MPEAAGARGPIAPALALASAQLRSLSRSPLLWAAVGLLALFLLSVKGLMSGAFVVNGKTITPEIRVVYSLSVCYSAITFLSTLLALCLCLDALGGDYLQGHDLLVLARPLPRAGFYLARMGAVWAATTAYFALGLLLFWVALRIYAGVNLYALAYVLPFQALGFLALLALHFALRFLGGHFLLFFGWLVFLPLNYGFNLWHAYGLPFAPGSLRAYLQPVLPQFGGLHAFCLGLVDTRFQRPGTAWALLNLGAWTALALGWGWWHFRRRKL